MSTIGLISSLAGFRTFRPTQQQSAGITVANVLEQTQPSSTGGADMAVISEASFLKGSGDIAIEMGKVVPVSYEKGKRAINGVGGFADSVTKLNEALAAFTKEASLTPVQRARRDVIKIMDLTEDAIKAMPAEQQKVTEQKIAAEVARRLLLGDADKDQTASASPG